MHQKILIIQTAWLGDNILTLPLVSNAAQIGEVHILTIPRWADVYKNNPDVASIITYDKHGSERGFLKIRQKAALLRKMNFDIALLAQRWWRSAALAKMAKIPIRIGFDTAPAKFLYTHTVRYDKDLNEAERLLNLLRPLHFEPKITIPKLYPSNADIDRAQEILMKEGWSGERIIVLAPESAWRTKRYPHFIEVAKMIVDEGFQVLFIGADKKTEAQIKKGLQSDYNMFFMFGENLLVAASAIGISDVMISNDSGAGHIASAVKVPVLSIFGPTVPEQGFAPLGEKNRIVQVENLSCRPCSAHGTEKCSLGHHKCMTEIEPEKVAEIAINMAEEQY